MHLPTLPPSPSNTVSSYQNPVESQPVSLESRDHEHSTFKPVSQSAESARLQSSTEHRAAPAATPSHLQDDAEVRPAQQEGASDAEIKAEQDKIVKEQMEKRQADIDRQRIDQLAARDREVRAHEQAHAAVGGQYAGAPSYQFERGPNGVAYAVAGEVPIDVGREGTPQETIEKAATVRRAALAPADPSPQDRRVAAQAMQMEMEARVELRVQQQELVAQADESESEELEAADSASESAESGLGLAGNEEDQSPNGILEDDENDNNDDNAVVFPPSAESRSAPELSSLFSNASQEPRAGTLLNSIA